MSLDSGQQTADSGRVIPSTVEGSARRGRGPSAGDGSTSLAMTRWFSAVCCLLSAVQAHACPVCFGNPNSPMTQGTSNGILFLLGIVVFVQIAFAALFVTFWRRARALRRRRESFHLIEGGAH